MPDPITLAAVTALVTWASTEMAESGRSAVSSLVTLVRERFRRGSAERDAIDAALATPEDEPKIAHLADVLYRESLTDQTFAEEFRARWEWARRAVVEAEGAVTNSVSGEVRGPVVQARDIHGGIHFGGSAQ